MNMSFFCLLHGTLLKNKTKSSTHLTTEIGANYISTACTALFLAVQCVLSANSQHFLEKIP